jgi:hypothetical protein
MTTSRIKNLLSALALAAALALSAAPALLADDGFRPIFHPPTLTFRNVRIESAFKGLDGKTFPAGAYDMDVRQGTQGILIALLKNGRKVVEFPGKFVPGKVDPSDPNLKAGMGDGSVRPSGGSTQGHDISVRKAGGMQDIHFDVASKVAFGGGGGAGKIACSLNFHPGGANLGWIEFQLPAVQSLGK